jgi:hypothetical protein
MSSSGDGGDGGSFGGGGGHNDQSSSKSHVSYGGKGCVRLIWGTGRSYPSVNVGDV